MSTLLILAVIANALQTGFLGRIWDEIAKPLGERLGEPGEKLLPLRRGVLLGMILLFPWCGFLVDRLGAPGVLFFGNTLAAVSLAWLVLGQTFATVSMAAVALGLAEAMVATGTVVLVYHGLLPGRPLMSLNLGFVAVAVGYLSTPFVVKSLYRRMGEFRGLLLLALGALLPGLLAGMSPALPGPTAEPLPLSLLFGDVRWWLMAGLGSIFFPLERWLFAWKDRYLDEPEDTPPYASIGFVVGFLGMRLLFGVIPFRVEEEWLLVILAGCYAVVLGNLVGSYRPKEAGLGFLFLGACFGPMLPAMMATLFGLFPRNPAGAAGLLFGVGSVSCLMLDPWLDRLTKSRSLKLIMKLSMFLTLVWGMIALVLALVR